MGAAGVTAIAMFMAPGALAGKPIKQAPPGTLTVNPTSAVAGSTNSFTFRWTAKAPVTASGVTLTLNRAPNWSPFQDASKGNPGYVALQKGTCTTTGIVVGANAVTVNGVKCSKSNQWIQLSYFNAVAPTATGPSEFTAALSTAPGTLMPATITTTAGPVASLAFLEHASSVVAGAVMAPPVQVRALDAYGNLASTTIALAFTPGTSPLGAVLGGTTSKPTTNGVASFSNLTVNKAATGYSLDASAGSAPTITDAVTFDVTPAAPASLALVLANPTIPADGVQTSTATATVQDAFGNGVPGMALNIVKDVSDDITFTGATLDNGDGTYTRVVQASTTKGLNTIIATCFLFCGTITTTNTPLTEVAAGDWLGAGFGTNGYVMNNYGTCCFGTVTPAADTENLPPGITYSDSDPTGYAWHGSEVLDPDAMLYDPAGLPQSAAYASYSDTTMNFNLTFNYTWAGLHVIRVYVADYDSTARTGSITASNLAGPIGVSGVSSFQHGNWVPILVDIPVGGDTITINVNNTNSASNGVLSGIFID